MLNSEVQSLIRPWDVHNQSLAAQVHPSDWVNPEPAPRYNLVVIGAGTAGLIAAAGAAGLGARVALIERHLAGGDCLNVGCVPSKAILRAAHAFAEVKNAGEYGVTVPPGVRVDFPKVMERMRRLRAAIGRNDSVRRYQQMGVDVFLGYGRFASTETVEVDGITLRFAKAVIATGARAAALPIPGLVESGALTNETVFSLTELPKRLAVIGAGAIGCELAQAFARFGSAVTLLELEDRILPREDPDAAVIVDRQLRHDGIEILCGVTVEQVEKASDGKRVHTRKNARIRLLDVDAILVGIGRAPNVEGLGLEKAEVEYSKLGVTVNDYLQTTNPSIYAAGDVCLFHKFTHVADAAARLVIQNALFGGRRRFSKLTIPWCTYTAPEIAHVGLCERDAQKSGISIQTFKQAFADVDRAVLDGETEGLVKIHVRPGTGQILGATIVARHAGEMISEVSVAMAGKVGLGKLANVIHPYPTQAEAIKKAADAFQRTRLTPFAKGLLTRWFNLARRMC